MKLPAFKVKKHTGLNPVARAVAKNNLRKAILDMRIQLFMLDEGESCASELATVSFIVDVLMLAMLAQERTDCPEFRKLRSAWGVLDAGMKGGSVWRRSHVVTLDNALEIAGEELARLPAQLVSECINMAYAGKSAMESIAS